MRHILGLTTISAAFAACVATPPPSAEGGLGIAVAPLTLPQLSKVCYDLRVTNDAAGGGSTVWAEGDPNIDGPSDTGAICSNTYGNGASGDITFVGACDASPKNPGDTGRTNSVTIWVDALYNTSNAVISPSGNDGWQDPCPNGCTLETLCLENTDASVEFNLTILRQANQGFFDIAVTFDDIFCSAKVDCVNSQSQPLDLLFNPATGQRDTTIVSAFACTAGPGAGTGTELFRDPLVVTCGATSTSLDPTAGLGNAFTTTNPDPKVDAIWQYATYAGDEALTCSGAPCNKLYWNVAIGLDETVDNCVLTTRMTAARNGQLTSYTTPSGTTYPYIDIIVPLSNTSGLQCTKHPVNGGNGVLTKYTPIASPEEFSHKFDGANFGDAAPLCASPCLNGGTCIGPNQCQCVGGYTGATCASAPGVSFFVDAGQSSSYGGTGSTWQDLGPSALQGTMSNVTWLSTEGGVMSMTNGVVSFPASQALNLGTGDFSVAGWMFYNTSTASDNLYSILIHLGSSSDYLSLMKWRSGLGNGILVDYATSGNRNLISTSAVMGDPRVAGAYGAVYSVVGVWTHYVVTMTGSVLRLYINGTLNGSVTIASSRWSQASSLTIGNSTSNSNPFRGRTSMFKVFKGVALNATEVAAEYSATSARYFP